MTDQWQKSLDITKKVSSFARYGARREPNFSSLVKLIAPTRIGTMEMSSLIQTSGQIRVRTAASLSLPLKDLPHVRQMHLYAVFILIGLNVHILELSRVPQFLDSWVK